MRKVLTFHSLTSSGSSHKDGFRNRKKKSPKNGVSPSEYVIRNILNYSRALAVFNIPDCGPISMLMN
jgi:hypothetical protein